MGVGIDALNNVIFSAGEDKNLKITNLIDQKIVFGWWFFLEIKYILSLDCGISHTALTNLHYDKESRRLIVTNKNGNVFVYDVTKVIVKL